MNKKRVMVVLPWADEGAAGIEQQMLLYAKHIDSDVFSFVFVPIVSREDVREAAMQAFGEGIDVRPVVASRSRSAMKQVRKIVKDLSVDLVVAAAVHLGTLCTLARMRGSFPPVVTINQGFNLYRLKDRLHTWFSAVLSRTTIAVSPSLADAVAARPFVQHEKVISISNPFDLSQLTMDVASFDSAKRHVVYVGRLEEQQKSISTLLEAVRLLDRSNVVLHIVGNGPDGGFYQAWVEEQGMSDQVLFHGWQDDPGSFIAASDVLVLPSRYEGFGRVLVEALALGVNVVSTDCPYGPADILEDGTYGRLVPVDDARTMARAIEDALEQPMDPVLLQTRAEAYEVSVIAPMFKELIESLV
jgi:glycosyltransferase involved in cell wall biosynthesis